MSIRPIFRNREEAGRQLGARLQAYRAARPLVLGVPRGGVAVAFEVARALQAPLDVLVARKLGAPWQPEAAVGAVAPGGIVVVNDDLDLRPADVAGIMAQERAEMRRRIRRFRGTDAMPQVDGRTVIVVDDGIATGLTMKAALRALREGGPAMIVLAVPVAVPAALHSLASLVDDVVCLAAPLQLRAVGEAYMEFDPVTDAEVILLLDRARRAPSPDSTLDE